MAVDHLLKSIHDSTMCVRSCWSFCFSSCHFLIDSVINWIFSLTLGFCRITVKLINKSHFAMFKCDSKTRSKIFDRAFVFFFIKYIQNSKSKYFAYRRDTHSEIISWAWNWLYKWMLEHMNTAQILSPPPQNRYKHKSSI